VYAIGDNTFGELGLQNEMQVEKFTKLSLKLKANIKKIAVGARHTLILLDNNELYAFGDNSEGQCTGQNARYSYPTKVEIEAKEKIVDIYCGYNHNLIVLCILNFVIFS
jgi:RCC1 and BTB domain-containing protein